MMSDEKMLLLCLTIIILVAIGFGVVRCTPYHHEETMKMLEYCHSKATSASEFAMCEYLYTR